MIVPVHRVIYKSGYPLLYVPGHSRAAQNTLGLYPAQTRLARWMRQCVNWAIRGRQTWFLRQASPPAFSWDAIDWIDSKPLPSPQHLGVLAGNPFAPGQRYIYLCMDVNGTPMYVVKVGFSPEAQQKIAAETAFLQAHGGRHLGIPLLLGSWNVTQSAGLVLPFVAGATPTRFEASLISVLTDWIGEEWVKMDDLPAWRAVRASIQNRVVGSVAVRPVHMHGDFAPWNIRVGAQGQWTVLDWERAQYPGVPGWDFFHYWIQFELLVAHHSPHAVYDNLSQQIQSPCFQAYAEKTNVRSIVQTLLEGYLHFALHLLKDNHGEMSTRQTHDSLNHLLEIVSTSPEAEQTCDESG
jgi:hypothetical protein